MHCSVGMRSSTLPQSLFIVLLKYKIWKCMRACIVIYICKGEYEERFLAWRRASFYVLIVKVPIRILQLRGTFLWSLIIILLLLNGKFISCQCVSYLTNTQMFGGLCFLTIHTIFQNCSYTYTHNKKNREFFVFYKGIFFGVVYIF